MTGSWWAFRRLFSRAGEKVAAIISEKGGIPEFTLAKTTGISFAFDLVRVANGPVSGFVKMRMVSDVFSRQASVWFHAH